MTLWLGCVVGAIALLCSVSAWRSHRELRAWLGRDALLARRSLRVALLISASTLVALTWLLAVRAPLRLSGTGVDVVLAIDVSRSMDARDTAPSRLRRAGRLAEQVLEQASGFRIGLVMFAGDAFPAVPLTHDRDALTTYVRTLDSELMSNRGSDLARALRVAADVFDPRSDRARSLILFSDGEHTGGDLDPALAHLRRLGVRLTAVGFGTPQGGPVPLAEGGHLEDAYGQTVVSRRADALLERIASATNGSYLREWEDKAEAAALLTTARARGRASEAPPGPSYEALLGLAALCLVLELLASTQRGRRFLARPAQATLLCLLSLSLLSCGPQSWLKEGDRLLEQGQLREALSQYRKAERATGVSPHTSIRIGNAYYRMGESRRAAAAYLEALRSLGPEDAAARFSANFNLGNTLLERSHYPEARDAFWAALRGRPTSLEAKFNYEWALERVEPTTPPPLPAAASRPADAESSRNASDTRAESDLKRSGGDARSSRIDPSEAERWLTYLEEPLAEPLRREIAEQMRGDGAGQSW